MQHFSIGDAFGAYISRRLSNLWDVVAADSSYASDNIIALLRAMKINTIVVSFIQIDSFTCPEVHAITSIMFVYT